MKTINTYISLICFAISTAQISPEDLTGLRAIGSPANPKVKVQWDKYHDYNEITKFCNDLQKAYPKLVKVESIGKSYEGRDLWVLKITDYNSGDHNQKPAFYIDGGIHANEMQTVQYAMYTAWYIVENSESVDFIKQLLKEKSFYILPTISPDSREHFIYKAHNPNSSRSGQRPFDRFLQQLLQA